MTRFSNDSLQLHALVNDSGMSAALTLRAVRSIQHSLGINTAGPDSGGPYDEVLFTVEQKPELMAGVVALESLFGEISLLPQNCITADGTHPGIKAFLQSHNPCGTNARGAVGTHGQILVPKAHLLVTQIGGSVGQTAVAQLRVICLSTDGVARPTIVTYNASLPETFVDDEEFTIGAPTIAGQAIDADHIQSWQIDTGVDITVIVAAGSTFATVVDVRKTQPVITVSHDDPSLLDDAKIVYEGIECDHADTIFPLHKRDPFGGLIYPTEEEHIQITAAGQATFTTHVTASGSATGTGEIQIKGTAGTGGVPLAVETGVALETT